MELFNPWWVSDGVNMNSYTASRTAEYAAAFRALETVHRPARKRLFEDRFAFAFLGREIQRYVRFATLPFLGNLMRSYIEWKSTGAMSSGITLTRLIDDWLRDSVRGGVRQVVLLGAGYDCRASRLPELAECRVVEIDHPATQTIKMESLKAFPGTPPDNVTYLAVDLTTQNLEDVWATVELDRSAPVFVLWEGVTHYLGETAVDSVLRALARLCAPDSLLAFTYLHQGLLDGSLYFARAQIAKDRVALGGEPWIWGMNPARLPAYLSKRGFQLQKDLGADEYRQMYWGSIARQLQGFGFYHVALARVAGRCP